MKTAPLAGDRIFARVDFGTAGNEIVRELFDGALPFGELFDCEGSFNERIGAFEVANESRIRVGHASSKLEVAHANLCKDQAA
jgi:hypothetical protein